MNAVQNFVFDDHLVRVVEIQGEPWFVGKDVCAVLGIKDHTQALENLDTDERGGYIIPTPRGDQTMIVISEPGMYRLIFKSRKDEAERFKRWLAHDVIPQIRKTGRFVPINDIPAPFEIDIEHAPLSAKVDLLRFVMRVRGRETAVAYMKKLGLPELPAPVTSAAAISARAEADECFAYLLDKRTQGDTTLREIIEEALEETEEAHRMLRDLGLRLVEDEERGLGLAVATNARAVAEIFGYTKWANGNHAGPLRALPGASRYKVMKVADRQSSHMIFIPIGLIFPGRSA